MLANRCRAVILSHPTRDQMNKKLKKQVLIAAAIILGFVAVMVVLSQVG